MTGHDMQRFREGVHTGPFAISDTFAETCA